MSALTDLLPTIGNPTYFNDRETFDLALAATVEALQAAQALGLVATSTTSISVGTGSKGPFTLVPSTRLLTVGETYRLDDPAVPPTYYMVGECTAASAGSATFNIVLTLGSGAKTAWVIGPALTALLPPNVANGSLVSDGSAQSFLPLLNPVDQSGALSVTTAHRRKLVNVTSAGTMSLPAAATAGAGFLVGFRAVASSGFAIDPNSSETINEAATLSVLPGDLAVCVSTGSAWLAMVDRAAPMGRGGIDGCTVSNDAGDLTNDLAISVGHAMDSTAARLMRLTTALTGKQLDVAWAAGSAAGLRYSSDSLGNGTWVLLLMEHLANNVTDVIAHLHSTTPTLPSGYVYKRELARVLREGGALVPFYQIGDEFYRKVLAPDYSQANQGTAAILVPLSVPLGIEGWALVTIHVDNGTTGQIYGLATSPSQTDSVPAQTLHNFASANGTSARGSDTLWVPFDTSGRIRIRASAWSTSDTIKVHTHGWRLQRGRNA